MNDKIKLIFAAPPGFTYEASHFGKAAVLGYRIGSGFHLYRAGGNYSDVSIMDIDCTGFTGFGPHRLLVSEIEHETIFRGYTGVIMDIPAPASRQKISFCTLLSEAIAPAILSVPEFIAVSVPGSRAIIRSDICGGTLSGKLSAAVNIFGADNIALYTDCSYTDHLIPCRDGTGRSVTETEAYKLISRGIPARYSPELMRRYLTYSSSGRTHMMLWDDEYTLTEKIRLSSEFGIDAVILCYPQVASFAVNLRNIK